MELYQKKWGFRNLISKPEKLNVYRNKHIMSAYLYVLQILLSKIFWTFQIFLLYILNNPYSIDFFLICLYFTDEYLQPFKLLCITNATYVWHIKRNNYSVFNSSFKSYNSWSRICLYVHKFLEARKLFLERLYYILASEDMNIRRLATS